MTRIRPQGRTPIGTPTITERWNAARAVGARTFDPGVKCLHGHRCERWTNSGICIECKRTRDNAYNAAHKAEHLARSLRSATNRPNEVRAYRKAYYAAHSDVAKQRAAEWARNNPERVRSSRRDFARRFPKLVRERGKRWRDANPEKVRAFGRRWKKANPHKVKEYENKRRARELGAQVGDRRAYAAFVKWARQAVGVPCYWCGTKMRPTDRHLDHIIPLARGGADAVANLCVSCATCNVRKNAKMPEEFAEQSELRLA